MCNKFVYKHSETKEFLFQKFTDFRANNSRILKIKNAKFSWYYFYKNTNIYEDFQISISVLLLKNTGATLFRDVLLSFLLTVNMFTTTISTLI